MEGEDGLHAEARQLLDAGPLDGESRRVVLTRSRLDPAPLDGKAVRVRPDGGKEVVVVLPALPMVGGPTDPLTRVFQPPARLPLRPVVLDGAFDLIGGGGDSPEEVRRSPWRDVSPTSPRR